MIAYVGTPFFVDRESAMAHYHDLFGDGVGKEVDRKLNDCEIFLGRPDGYVEGDTRLVVRAGRYFINCEIEKKLEHMTTAQVDSLLRLCERYNEEFHPEHFHKATMIDGLPDGYWVGKVGPLFVGVSPDGRICS